MHPRRNSSALTRTEQGCAYQARVPGFPHLIADDWRAIERAFAANRDPIADIEERDFQKLFTRIANLAPAPVGLGDPWKKGPART